MSRPIEVPITTEFITLGQLLKLAGMLNSGSEAKAFLAAGGITVNGEEDNRRGRKLRPDDVITLADGTVIRVTG